MHFLTFDECRDHCNGIVRCDTRGYPVLPSDEPRYVRLQLPQLPGLTQFCRNLERFIRPREACLLWITDWGVWRSSENLHLYYRLRQSYGDQRQLQNAPGHLFLDYEGVELISFLEVGIICGWDMHVIPSVGYARIFVSHDEFVELAADESNQALADEFVANTKGAEIRTSDRDTA